MKKPGTTSVKEQVPFYQRVYRRIQWILLGAVLVGALLDSISNAISVITTTIAFWVTLLTILTWVCIHLYIRKRGLTWVAKDGRKIIVKKMGGKITLPLLGVILILWVPSFIEFVKKYSQKESNKEVITEVEQPKQVAITKKVTILLTDLKAIGTQDSGVTQIIQENLDEAIRNYSDMTLIRLNEVIENSDDALKRAEEKHADIILWGSYILNEKNVRLTIQTRTAGKLKKVDLDFGKETMISTLADFNDFTVQEELSSRMTYMILIIVGIGRYEAEDNEGAVSLLTDALKYKPPSQSPVSIAQVYNRRGCAYLGLSQDQNALIDFNQAIRLDANLVGGYSNRGLAYMRLGNYRPALADFHKSLSLARKNYYANLNLAVLHIQQQQFDPALKVLDRALEYFPDDRLLLYNHSIALLLKKQYEPALLEINKVIAMDVDQPLPYMTRATILDELGQLDNAVTDVNHAINLDPSIPEALDNRANYFLDNQKLDEALADVNRAIELRKDFSPAYMTRAIIYLIRKNYTAALNEVNEAIVHKPHWGYAHCMRATVYSLLGQGNLALANYDQCLEYDPKYFRAYLNKAIIHTMTGDDKKALLDLKKYVEIIEAIMNTDTLAEKERKILTEMARKGRWNLERLRKKEPLLLVYSASTNNYELTDIE
jgi:tetratricopeptide (TPR) repeat protein